MNTRGNKRSVKNLEKLIIKEIKKIPSGPLSLFLSGGLDCSLVLALIRSIYPDRIIRTFTLAKSFDHPDIKFAIEVSNMFKTTHHSIIISDLDFMLYETLYDKIKNNEGVGNINWYILCKYASMFLGNIITGDGGDECFGGYWLHEYPLGHKETGEVKSYKEIHNKPKLHLDDMLSMGLRDFKFKSNSNTEDFDTVWKYYLSVFKTEQLDPLAHISEHFGLTVYRPLYSEEIIKFMGNLSYNFRIKKSLLRELAKLYLPESIVYREKYNLPSALNHENWIESCKPVN